MELEPKVVIVGCGFIGSHIAEELAKLCFSQDIYTRFKFIDFDQWEERNAANQHVNLVEAERKEYKALTCARYASNYVRDPSAIEAVTEKLTGENVNRHLEGCNLIIDAVDNIPTRQLLWGYALAGRSGPVMHTGISRRGDGMINWSSPNFDTFPFRPENVAGRTLKEQDVKEPPCEMYKHRTAGLFLVQAIAKATAFFYGKDPWGSLDGIEEPGTMTCWNTTDEGLKLLLDDVYLHEGTFPVFGAKNERL